MNFECNLFTFNCVDFNWNESIPKDIQLSPYITHRFFLLHLMETELSYTFSHPT